MEMKKKKVRYCTYSGSAKKCGEMLTIDQRLLLLLFPRSRENQYEHISCTMMVQLLNLLYFQIFIINNTGGGKSNYRIVPVSLFFPSFFLSFLFYAIRSCQGDGFFITLLIPIHTATTTMWAASHWQLNECQPAKRVVKRSLLPLLASFNGIRVNSFVKQSGFNGFLREFLECTAGISLLNAAYFFLLKLSC